MLHTKMEHLLLMSTGGLNQPEWSPCIIFDFLPAFWIPNPESMMCKYTFAHRDRRLEPWWIAAVKLCQVWAGSVAVIWGWHVNFFIQWCLVCQKFCDQVQEFSYVYCSKCKRSFVLFLWFATAAHLYILQDHLLESFLLDAISYEIYPPSCMPRSRCTRKSRQKDTTHQTSEGTFSPPDKRCEK